MQNRSKEKKAKRRAYQKAYQEDHYKAHKEEIKARRKDYYKAHKEEIKARQKVYDDANKEKKKAYNDARKEEKKAYDKARYEKKKQERGNGVISTKPKRQRRNLKNNDQVSRSIVSETNTGYPIGQENQEATFAEPQIDSTHTNAMDVEQPLNDAEMSNSEISFKSHDPTAFLSQNNSINNSSQLNSINTADQHPSVGLPVISNITSQSNNDLIIKIPFATYKKFINELPNANDDGKSQDPVFNSPRAVKLSSNPASLFNQQPIPTVSIDSQKPKTYFNEQGEKVETVGPIFHKGNKQFIKNEQGRLVRVFQDFETYFTDCYYLKTGLK